MPYSQKSCIFKTDTEPLTRDIYHGGLKTGDHICAFHRNSADYINATKSFILDGIANNQKTIFFTAIYHQEEIFKKIENEGWNINELFNTQQIEMYDMNDTYLRGGSFNPGYISELSIQKAKKSLDQGYTATRIAGNGCRVAGCADHRAWIKYERSVSMEALKELNFIAVCNYFIDSLPGPLLNQILESHPLCQFGEDLLVNQNYLPLNLNQKTDPAKAEFEYRLDKMYEHKQREDIIFGLYRKTQKLSEFSHILSHELKAPIRTASVLGEMLTLKSNKSDQALYKELSKSLKTAYSRLASVEALSSVITIAQKNNKVHLKEIIENIVYEVQQQYFENEVHITLKKLKNNHIFADQTHIHQVLHNLIENAIKYKKDVPLEITISMEVTPQEETIIHIQDNGTGIDPRFHDKIFMPFVQLSPTTNQKGKGMGLRICNRIMEIYGGSIQVNSKVRVGSTFSLVFPKMILN